MYKYLNVNPENRKESDCVIRAISLATDSDYYLIERVLLNIGDIYSCDELCLQCYNHLLSHEIGYTCYNGNGKKVFACLHGNFHHNIFAFLYVRIKIIASSG